jgi:hypothetical protein
MFENLFKGYFKPEDLPNQDGFHFVGLTTDGEVNCMVKKDQEKLAHYVVGAKYCDLIGWRNVRQKGEVI